MTALNTRRPQHVHCRERAYAQSLLYSGDSWDGPLQRRPQVPQSLAYLIVPEMKLLEAYVPAKSLISSIETEAWANMANWVVSRRPWSSETLALALRHGSKTRTGILVLSKFFLCLDSAHRRLDAYRGALSTRFPSLTCTQDTQDDSDRGSAVVNLYCAAMELHQSVQAANALLAFPEQPVLRKHWRAVTKR